MKETATYVRVNRNEKAENPIEKQTYIIEDGADDYDKLIELLSTAKQKGIEKIVMSSADRITGTPEELEKLAKAFKECEVPIVTINNNVEENSVPKSLASVESEDSQDGFTQTLM